MSHIAVTRALSMRGQKIAYVLGAGGKDPDAVTPATTITKNKLQRTGCDCMGFVAWCLGFARFQRNYPYYGGWINTDSMLGRWNGTSYTPAIGWFNLVEKPEAGDLLVYPGIDLDRDGVRDRVGHVALITNASNYDGTYKSLSVIHCSSSHYKKTGDAIGESDGSLWDRSATFKGQTNDRWRGVLLRFVRAQLADPKQ